MAGVPSSILNQTTSPPPTSQLPGALYNLPNYASVGAVPSDSYGNSIVSDIDPFNILSQGNTPGGAYNEQTSPGYQSYGNDWLNLIGALSSNTAKTTEPDYNLPGTNVPTSVLQGYKPIPTTSLLSSGQQQSALSAYDSSVSSAIPGSGSSAPGNSSLAYLNLLPTSNALSQGGANPLAIGGNLGSTIEQQFSESGGNQAIVKPLDNLALPLVAQSLGLDPKSIEAQNYADAYVTYVLQENNYQNTQDALTTQHQSGDFEHIFGGDIGKALGFAAAGGGVGAASGAGTAVAAGAEAASDSAEAADTGAEIAAEDSATLAQDGQTLGEDANTVAAATGTADGGNGLSVFNAAKNAINAGTSLAQHNPLGAIESGISGVSGLSTGSTTNGNINTLTSAPSVAPTGGDGMSWLDDIGNFFSGGSSDPSISGAQAPASTAISGSGGLSLPASGGVSLPSAAGNISGGAATAAPAGSSFSNFLSNPSLSGFGSFLSKNANILAPAAGLGFQALEGNSPPKGLSQVEGQAAQLNSQGQQLQGYLNSGTLPPGVQASLTQAAESAKAAIKSQYAARGMSGSSAEQQDLANVDQQVNTEGTNFAMQLLQQGTQETGLSSQLYSKIMEATLAQDQSLGSAVANFATAAGGGSGNQPKGTLTFGG